MVRAERFGRRVLALVLGVALTAQALPVAAFAEAVSGEGNSSLSATASGGGTSVSAATFDMSSLEEGSYVEGEAIVLYHAEPAEEAASEAEAALASEDGSDSVAGLLSDAAAEVPGAAALALEGFSVTNAWDVSAPDDDVALASVDDDATSADEAPEAQANATDADLRIALVAKDGSSTEDILEQLSALDYVVTAEPNQICTVDSATPDDTYFENWQSSALTDDATGISLDAAINKDTTWSTAAATGTSENIVAVIDTGVDFSNPDLASMAWTNPGDIGLEGEHGYDFGCGDADPSPEPDGDVADSHGTHCAGLIAAQANNGQGIVGSAQSTKIMALKTAYPQSAGSFRISAIIASYEYVVKALAAGQNVAAINNSWHQGAYSAVLDYLVNQAGKLGALSFFAAGNSATNIDSGTSEASPYGATCGLTSPYAVIVAASNQTGSLATFSNYGATSVDVAAPGALTLSTVENDDVASKIFWSALRSKQAGEELLYYDDFSNFTPGDYKYQILVPYTAADGTVAHKYINSAEIGDANLLSFETEGVTLYGEPALKITLHGDKLEEYMYAIDPSWTSAARLSGCSVIVSKSISNYLKGLTSLDDYRISLQAGISGADTSTSVMAQAAALISQVITGADGTSTTAAAVLASTGSYCAASCDNIQTSAKFDELSSDAEAALNTSDTMSVAFSLQFSGGTDGPKDANGKHELTAIVTGFGFGSKDTYQPYGQMSGTSMATPTLVGAYVELAKLYPGESALELRGRVVGSTVATKAAGYSADWHTATDGRFSFEAGALDDDGSDISANTWSAEADTATGTVTLYGRGLGDASVVGDDGTVLEVDSRAEDGSWLKVKVGASLFDGASHRFDVTDASTKKTHKASYAMPSASAETIGSELSKVISLPADTAASGVGAVVSTPAGMVYADTLGSYTYLCTDPSAEGASWQKIAAPGLPWASNSSDNNGRLPISYVYAEGTLYAFCSDYDSSGNIVFWASTYDLSAGTAGSWSAYKQLGTYELPSYEGAESVGIEVTVLRSAAANGVVYCLAEVSESVERWKDDGTSYTTTNTYEALLSAPAGTCDFSMRTYSVTSDLSGVQPVALVGGTMLSALAYYAESAGENGKSSVYRLGLLTYNADTATWQAGVVDGSPAFNASTVADFAESVVGSAGGGLVLAAKGLGSYGDLAFIDTDSGKMESLGSYGLLTSKGYVVKGLQVLNGTLYVCAFDARTGAAGGSAASTAGDGSSDGSLASADSESAVLGALYALPASAQAKVGSTDAAVEAQAGEGGSASVADWRGGAAGSAQVRLGDKATWTAVAADGYTFAGWYDVDGNLVSTDAKYSQVVTGVRTLAARFSKSASPIPGGDSSGSDDNGGTGNNGNTGGTTNSDGTTSAGSGASGSAAEQASAGGRRALPRTGDDTSYVLPAVLAVAGFALVAAAVVVVRRRK